ncbi:MAG TPA: M14 family zinc carboxypeptidase [Bacteroidales bacterium]|nr:M14 family zinc carboxypeptidase [Bacteroidales bacterium]
MKENKLPAIRGLVLLVASLLMAPVSLSAIEKYSDPATVNRRIEQLRQANQSMVKVHKLAVTPGGREMLMIEIGRSGTSVPAVLVGANMSGLTPVATEAALELASRIVADASLNSSLTWYIVPVGNPDAHARYFTRPLWSDPANGRPFNDDTDDQTDEDGYNDLDGNGIITMMRVKAHDGAWVPVEGEPRLMRRADASKGEKGIYKLYTEGIDDDGDGKYNEDVPGGTNVNINFPHLFKSFGRRSGLYPGSEPESAAMLKFAFAHPEIAMMISFGQTNYLLSPPQGGRKGSVDTENIRIPREIGSAMGIDVSRSYTMDEIIELVQPMMPPGMQADESMIASFLGLGAVVNPLPDDMAFYNEISSEYKEYLKKKGVTAERFDPAQPEDGSFELWAYYHLGLPVFTMDFWGLPKPKEEKKEEGSGITAETLGKMTSDEFLALGEEKIAAFLKESGAPAQFTAQSLMTMVRNGQMKPEQMAAMMKRMPEAKGDEKKGDPKETAQLAFSDKWLAGKGFTPWKSYSHPTLGEVEIGGFTPFTDNTPPESMVDSLLAMHLPYITELVSKLPKLTIAEAKVTEKGGGVYQLEAWIANEGYLPFPTAMGKRNKVPAPAIITLEGDGVEILSGKKRTPVTDMGAMKSVRHIWLVRSPKKGSLTMKLESKQAGNDTKKIIIGG